jgi:hypothetical protein
MVVKKAGYMDYPCEVVQLDLLWDREERTPEDEDIPGEERPPIVSPAPPPVFDPPEGIDPFELCYETSVIMFGAGEDEVGINLTTTSILGSRNFHKIDNEQFGYEYGWARLNMANATFDYDESGEIEEDEEVMREPLGGLLGLPVTGFRVESFENTFLGDGADVLANYGGIFQHKYTRAMGSCERTDGPNSCEYKVD